jgi:hypothetical protein
MKALAFVFTALLLAAPVAAQPSLLGDVAAERAKYGAAMSPGQVAAMLNQVAWNHRAEGRGLLRKGAGNSCPLRDTFISCDILIHAPSVQHFDVLQDAENTARPQWNLVGPCVLSDSSGCSMANFLAPFDPGGPVTPPYVPPVVVPPYTPVPPSGQPIDLSSLAKSEQVERIYLDLSARLQLLATQMAAEADRTDALSAQLTKHDNDPSWVRKFFTNSNTYVAVAGVLGGYMTHKAAK